MTDNDLHRRRPAATDKGAADLASRARDLLALGLDRQMQAGLGLVDSLARSIHVAAQDMRRSSPYMADFLDMGGDRLADVAHDFRGGSVDDFAREAGRFSRANPALVFGAAFLGGLVVTRLVAATAPALQAATRTAREEARDTADRPDTSVPASASEPSEVSHGV